MNSWAPIVVGQTYEPKQVGSSLPWIFFAVGVGFILAAVAKTPGLLPVRIRR